MVDAKEWHVVVDGQSVGPLALVEIMQGMQTGQYTSETLVFRQGMTNWTPAAQIPELSSTDVTMAGPAPDFGATIAAPAPSFIQGGSDSGHSPSLMHEVDYKIFGEDMQYVEVELDPGEAALSEAGAMMYMTDGIEMQTIFGDGSKQSGGGIMDKLLGAGKRVLTGESLFMTEFANKGQGKQQIAFAAPYPGTIMPVNLAKAGGKLICQKDAFLCAAMGVAVGIAFQKKIGVGLFGGEGFIMQSLEGDGYAFLHAGGVVVEKELRSGETLRVDTGCIVALQPSIDYDIQKVGGVKSMIFGGEGFFFAKLSGPGTVWLQSLPFSRMAGRIWASAPQGGGRSKGEGSVLGQLGGIGGMFDGS